MVLPLDRAVAFPQKHGLPENNNLRHYNEGIFVPSTFLIDKRYCAHA